MKGDVAMQDLTPWSLDEFDIEHHALGFQQFFKRIVKWERRYGGPVAELKGSSLYLYHYL